MPKKSSIEEVLNFQVEAIEEFKKLGPACLKEGLEFASFLNLTNQEVEELRLIFFGVNKLRPDVEVGRLIGSLHMMRFIKKAIESKIQMGEPISQKLH